jgi:hypothetical protein
MPPELPPIGLFGQLFGCVLSNMLRAISVTKLLGIFGGYGIGGNDFKVGTRKNLSSSLNNTIQLNAKVPTRLPGTRLDNAATILDDLLVPAVS